MRNMTLTLTDADGDVLDMWHMDDELSRALFADFAELEDMPSVTASHIRTRLATFEEKENI